MEIDVGLDAVGLTYEVETQIAVHAARLGYRRIWTGSIGDPFQTCVLRWAETRTVLPAASGLPSVSSRSASAPRPTSPSARPSSAARPAAASFSASEPATRTSRPTATPGAFRNVRLLR